MSMTEKWTIYCHIHTETGRRYFGLTKKTMMFRWNQHVQNAEKKTGKGCRHFWNAIRKYGKDAFTHEVFRICTTLEEANLAERALVKRFRTRDPKLGFNLTRGGVHTPHPIRKNPWDNPEYRVSQTLRLLALSNNPVTRAANKAALNTPESKERRTAASKKSHSRPEVKAKISAAFLGKKRDLTEEQRKRLSVRSKGRITSNETKEKISKTSKIASNTPKEKIRRSVLMERRWQNPEYREKTLCSLAIGDSVKRVQALKVAMAKPEVKMKITTSNKKRAEDPEFKKHSSEAAKSRWQDPEYRAKTIMAMKRKLKGPNDPNED